MPSLSGPRVLLIGLDAADPALLVEWARADRLPVLGELIGKALVAELEDLPGLWTGAVWPSLITGASPTHHGYYHYHDYDPLSYATAPFVERGYPVAPFWETLSRTGKRVAVLDVPLAPLSESLPGGLQLVDWAVHEPEGPARSLPADLASSLIERFGSDRVGQCDFGGRGPTDLGVFRDGLVDRVRARKELTRHVMKQGSWDLVVSVFSETHCVGHQCWHVHDPGHPMHEPETRRLVGDPVLEVYQAVDQAVGELLEHGRDETDVLIVASHGMGQSFRAHFLLDRVLQRIEGTRARGSRLFNLLYRGWRRLPATWRSALRPAGSRARKSLGAAARRNRRSFELNTHCGYGAIRVNLEGREAEGKVAAGDFERYCDELTLRLRELTDPASGQPVVRRVLRTADHYERTPTDVLPDLIVEWERDLDAVAVFSPRLGQVKAVAQAAFPNRTGDHRPSGGLLLRIGPGTAPRTLARPASVMDVAPTVFEALNMDAGGFEGRPIA